MSYDLGTARGKITLDYDGTGADKAKTDVDDLGKKSGNTNAAMNKVANGAGVAGLAIAGGLALGVNAAANFEQRMSAVAAVSGASGAEMDKLSDKALQLGKDTQFSASESAQAIEELVKAGLSVSDVLNGAADATVNLAAAGEVSMPEAAAISSNAMNQFGLAAKDMVGVVDSIAGAANASAIDVSDFGQSLSQVGAVAHLAGVSFDDTATAIALMGNAGIKGSDAGTSLKSMFSRLQPTTKKTADLFKELGLTAKDGSNVFYDQEGKLKGLSQVSGILHDKLKGMTQQQKQATLQTLFGSDAIRAAAILSNQGAKGFDKMAGSMKKVSAADVAKKRMDNFKGSLEQMKGSLETAGIAMGTVLLPALRSIVDAITGVLNVFLGLPGGVQKAIVIFAVVVAAILLVVSAVMKVIIFINTFRTALLALRGTMIATWLAALGPIALVIAAVAAIVIVIVLLWKKSETFRNIVLGVWHAIQAAVGAVVGWFKGLPAMFSGIWGAIQGGLSAIGGFFKSVWDGIVNVVKVVFSVIAAIFMVYFNIWKTIITTALNVIKAVWGAVWGAFGPIVKAVFGLIVAIIQLAWAIIKGVIILQLMAIKAVFSAVWNAIVSVIRVVWNIIKAVVGAGARFVGSIVRAVWNGIKAATSAVWNAIMGVIRAVWGRIGGTVMGAVNKVKSLITGAWNVVKNITNTIWNNVVRVIATKIGDLIGKVKGIAGKVKGALSGAGTWLLDAGKKIVQGLIDGITAMIGKLTDKIHSITDKVKKFLPGSPVKEGPLKVLNRGYAGKQIMRMLIDGMDSVGPELADVLDTYTRAVPQTAVATAPGVPASSRPGTTAGPLRLVKGVLRIDKSGRAWIEGIAEEAVDDNNEQHARAGRRK